MPVIEITTKIGCAISCVYCPQDKIITAYAKRSNVFEWNSDVFKACIDKIPVDVDILFAGMCEPFLNPECSRMILYAHEKGHRISVDTTLMGIGVSDIDLLEWIPFGYFCVHLPCDEGYEKIEVDENYLKVLNKIATSKIRAIYHYHGDNVYSKLKPLIKANIRRTDTSTRAGNVKIKNKPFPNRKQGIIGCERDLRWNVLFPNGDVILCSLDYEMRHILGNLISADYESLFHSEEFSKIKKGLKKEHLDILCRYCDMYSYKISLSAKIYKCFILLVQKFVKNTHRLKPLYQFIQKAKKAILR